MTGPEHYLKAQQLQDQAEKWANADHGWMASMPTEERISRRMADLADAQVHATLALAAATAINPSRYGMDRAEPKAWVAACRTSEAVSSDGR